LEDLEDYTFPFERLKAVLGKESYEKQFGKDDEPLPPKSKKQQKKEAKKKAEEANKKAEEEKKKEEEEPMIEEITDEQAEKIEQEEK